MTTKVRILAAMFLALGVAGIGSARPALAATLTVTDCSGEYGPGRIGTVISSASFGDTIIFSCSGTIPISSTLRIVTNLTLDGSAHKVELDGGNRAQVLSVGSGVFFKLNALVIAHGNAGIGGGGNGLGNGLFNNGTVGISNGTFASNIGDGGGLFNNGTATIFNSTFAYNQTLGGSGGGLFNSGTATILDSTIANNFDGPVGDGLFNERGTVSIGGSIVANNTGFVGRSNCFGGLHDSDYNLESGTDCGFTGTGSLQNTDPKLDPNGLQNNGGPTLTFALEPDSLTVDHIPVSASCPAMDQRGVSRPQGPACDIGAFEMTAADGLRVMIHVAKSFPIGTGLRVSLDAHLQAALTAVTAGDIATACSDLSDLVSEVQAQSGRGLTTAQATQLVNEARVIETRLSC
jgi:hypothetical protein